MVKACYHQRKRVSIQGAQALRSLHEGQLISTEKLSQWRFFQPDDMVLGADAGIPFETLKRRALEEGMDIPASPWFRGSTLGGMVSNNQWGPERMMAGGIRDAIIGLEYIDGEGRLVKSGGRVVKNVTGYDLGKMMTGSHGGLGLITGVNLKMQPAPVTPQRAVFHMRGTHWMTWFREEVHEAAIPLDWAQAVHKDGAWWLGMGYSGPAQRRKRIERDLAVAFDDQISFAAEETPEPLAPWFAPEHRHYGFLSAHVQDLDAYFHLMMTAPTSAFLGRERLHKALLDIPDSTVIMHPVGGDAHVVGPVDQLTEDHVDLLRRALAGTGGYLVLRRAAPALIHSFGQVIPLPGEYGLQQHLKKCLDPRNIFVAPFYEMV